MKVDTMKKRLQEGEILIKDGAMGTEILRRGIPTPVPLWSAYVLLLEPNIVKEIHADYISAGSDIITTNTFRTTARTLHKIGFDEKKAREITLLACDVAKEAIRESGRTVYLAGSIAPLEDCYSPSLTPPVEILRKEHQEYARNVKDGGVDFLLIETMITIRETEAACMAAKAVNLPLAVSFCCTDTGTLLSGESLLEAMDIVKKYNPLFVGMNCMTTHAILQSLSYREDKSIPFAVYAQGDGMPAGEQGWRFQNHPHIKRYVQFCKTARKKGATVIGGCCGTSPEYIQSVSQSLKI